MAGNSNVVQIKFEGIANFNNVLNNIKSVRSALQNIKMPEKLSNSLENNINKTITSIEKLQAQAKQGFTKPGDVTRFEKELSKADVALNRIVKDIGKLDQQDIINLNIDTSKINEVKQQINNLKRELATNVKGAMLDPSIGLKGSFSGMDQILKKGTQTKKVYTDLVNSINKGNLSQATAHWERLQQLMNQYNKGKLNTAQWQDFQSKVTQALKAAGVEAEKLTPLFTQLDKKMEDALNVGEGNYQNKISQLRSGVIDTAAGFDKLKNSERDAAQGMLTMNQQMNQLRTQANYFFGLQNMFQLLKRGIQGAVETIKELDASMTETAVVTDFSVSDMWNMLPEYTKAANELGSTINDVYQAATLYYQQGLEQDQAMGLATETLKMARIGGLQAAEATDMMTASLRGFNMELDETSAKRINDVYSNLAAKTASDTRELGEAMERTASISHSANMEFETTAAFLANMIETTREAPENLGTAMKTIVARFQEMKKNPNEIVDVDGEEVSFNRVDTALKSIGVRLTESRDKFRDLDDVFLEISQKWDTLSQTQQRYIATIAAGSRQQSRFIAMVANYKRTMELVSYANDSAGASNVQFEKTLDSMAAKMNKFKNAWDQFVMGITNNKLVKFAVDFGTDFIGLVNKIINAISGGNGLIKSVLSLVAAFTGLKVAGKFINSSLGLLGKAIDPSAKGGFLAGASGRKAEANATQAKLINQPIVSVLRQILSVMPTKANVNANAKNMLPGQGLSDTAFKGAYKNIRDILYKGTSTEARLDEKGKAKIVQTYKYSDLIPHMQGMNSKQQGYVLKNNPSLRNGIRENLTELFTNGKTDLSMKDKLKVRETINAIEKYAQTSGTGLKVENLLDAKTNTKSQNKIVQALAAVDDEVGKTYQKNYQEAQEKWIKNSRFKELSEERQAAILERSATRRTKEDLGYDFGAMSDEKTVKNADKLAQSLGKIGGGAQSAGMALQGMGTSLSAMGLETLGGVVSGLGTAFMSLGSVISGVGSAIETIGMGPMIGIGAAVAGIVAAVALWKKHQEDIKEDAQEVADNYKKTTEDTTQNIQKLEEYQNDYYRLSQGVDENGNNVSLGAEEYRDYLKMTNEIAEMSPELIKGWNSEGNAILDKNRAIEEAIRLQKQEQELAAKEYTDKDALRKTYNAMEINPDYKLMSQGEYSTARAEDGGDSQIKRQAQKAARLISQAGGNDILKAYGIDPESISDMSEEAMRILEQHGSQINNTVKKQLTDIDEKQLSEINDSIAEYGKSWDKYRESYAELLQQFQVKAGQEGLFDDINENMGPMLDQTIENVVADTTIPLEQKWEEIEAFHKRLKDLDFDAEGLEDFGKSYESILEGVKEAQEDFDSNLDSDAYKEATGEWLADLERWATAAENEYERTKDNQYKILHEMLVNQTAQIKNYTEENTATMAGAFNTLEDEISSAQSAYEAFQKSVESGDYYTAAEGIQKIVTEVIGDGSEVDIDNTGKGSKSYWTAADMVLGRENLYKTDKNGDKELKSRQEVTKELKTISKSLTPGREGANNMMAQLGLMAKNNPDAKVGNKKFSDFFKYDEKTGNVTSTKNLENIKSEDLDALAQSMGRSTDALVAGLNNAKQFYNISFTNQEGLYKALKSSGTTLAGEGGKMYTSEAAFEAEGAAQGMSIPEIEDIKDDLEKKGVRFIPSADEITSSDMQSYIKNWGIETNKKGQANQKDLIKYFDKAGFSKDEIEQAIETAKEGGVGIYSEGNKSYDEDYAEAHREIEDPTLASINTYTGGILTEVQAIAVGLGIVSKDVQDNAAALRKELRGETGVDTVTQQYGAGYVNGHYVGGDKVSDADFNEAVTALENKGAEIDSQLALTAGWSEEQQEQNKQYIDDLKAAQATNDAALKNLKALRETDYKDLTVEQKAKYQAAKNGTSGEKAEAAWADFITKHKDELSKMSNEEFQTVAESFGKVGEKFGKNMDEILQNKDYLKQTIKKSKEEETAKDYAVRIDAVLGDQSGSKLLQEINEIMPKGTDEKTKKLILEAAVNGDTEKIDELTKNWSDDKKKKVKELVTKKTENTTKKVTTKVDNKKSNQDLKSTQDKADKLGKTKSTVKINVGGDAFQKIPLLQQELLNIDTTKTITVNAKKGKGSKVTVSLSGASGINNNIPTTTLPSFNSLAKGTKNKKFKGGPTLTGEEGFEIAWLPSEGRSMILGTEGPQMIDLPSDAIVWNNKQSKKILKQKPKNMNSMAGGNTIKVSFNLNDVLSSADIYGGNGSSGSGGSGGKGKNKTTSKSSSKGGSQSKEIIKLKNFSVYIFNMTQKIEQVQRKIEDRQRKINKLLEKAYITNADIHKIAGQEVAYIKQSISLNKRLESYYKKQLKKLDTGKLGKETIKWSNTQKTKKKGESKWSTGSKSHKAEVNLGKYIKYDPSTGAYVVDQKQINKVANSKKLGGYNKAKAIAEAAQKQIEKFTSGRDKATDNIQAAEDKLQELAKQVYDTFYGWENELTRIYQLTQNISRLDKQKDRYSGLTDLKDAILNSGLSEVAGMTSDNLIKTGAAFRGQIENLVQSISQGASLIDKRKQSLNDILSNKKNNTELSSAKEQKTQAQKEKAQAQKDIKAAKKILKSSKASKKAKQNAKAKLNAAQEALEKANGEILEANYRIDQATDNQKIRQKANNYIKTTKQGDGTVALTIKADDLENDRLDGKITQEEYEAIKKLAEQIEQANEDLIQAYQDEATKLAELYNTLQDLKQQYADYAADLRGWLKDNQEAEIDRLEKLNNSLNNALKELLDEVKKRLDQRRQQEDNTKTENDISQKQQRLAALRADSSGSNAKAIKQLEKEIADAQQGYTRTLEDQTLQRMQDEADEASKQRERQIDLLKTQLEWQEAIGLTAREVEKILAEPQTEENRNRLWELFKENNKWDTLTTQEQDALTGKFDKMMNDLSLSNGIPAQIKLVEKGIKDSNEYLKLISLAMLKNSGMSLKDFLNSKDSQGNNLYSTTQARQAGYTASDFKQSGFSVTTAKNAGFTLKDLKEGGYTIKDFQNSNRTTTEMRTAGFSATEMRKAGYNIQQLKGAGYSDSDILKAGYTTADLLKNGYTGQQIQSATGRSGSSIESAINANISNPNVTKTDLAGVSETVDTNGKSKGGTTTAHFGNSGKWLVAAKGSSLLYYDPSNKKKVDHTVPIGKLTAAQVKNNKAEAIEAISYAIKHTQPGSKINSKMGALIKEAGLGGKTYKLKNKHTGSLTSSGNIHYDVGTDHVSVWNLNTGKITKRKWNKKNFKNWAGGAEAGREYKQVNDARKKKKLSYYKTGGLATSTGPAWLDGTKSKPELVLNAQDTKNFLALKDTLSKAVSGTKGIVNDMNMTYDIDINVDHISNDYDVDQIANRIQKKIIQSAGYRNVNAVRNLR